MKRVFGVVVFLGVFSAALAQAEVAPNVSVSQVQPSMMDSLSISYYGTYSGPSLGQPSTYQVDPTSGQLDMTSKQNIDNVIYSSVKLPSGLGAGLGIQFKYFPFSGMDYKLSNPYLRVSNSKVIDTGAFNLAVDLRYYIPVTVGSRNSGHFGGLRSTQTTNYDFPESRWSISTYSLVIGDYYSSGSSAVKPNLQLFGSASVNYRLNPKMQFSGSVAGYTAHNRTTPMSEFVSDAVETDLGLTWDPNESLSINPYIGVYPVNPSLTTSRLGLFLSAKLL